MINEEGGRLGVSWKKEVEELLRNLGITRKETAANRKAALHPLMLNANVEKKIRRLGKEPQMESTLRGWFSFEGYSPVNESL